VSPLRFTSSKAASTSRSPAAAIALANVEYGQTTENPNSARVLLRFMATRGSSSTTKILLPPVVSEVDLVTSLIRFSYELLCRDFVLAPRGITRKHRNPEGCHSNDASPPSCSALPPMTRMP